MDRDFTARQRAYYDTSPEDYDHERATRGRAYERKARLLQGALPERLGAVLEVGAGSGLVTGSLAPRLQCERYVALDFSEAMLAAARARVTHSGVTFVHGDAMATGLEAESFDAVVGVDILHHLPDPVRALSEWRRVVRPGGRLAVLETNALHPANRAFLGVEHEVRVFLNTEDNLASWAREAGWEGVSVGPTAAYTPSGPRWLSGALDALDRVAVRVPGARWLTALWALTATR